MDESRGDALILHVLAERQGREWPPYRQPPPDSAPVKPVCLGCKHNLCAREGLDAPHVDPVTGFKDPVKGPDCRDLNPNGECPHHEARPWLLSLSPLGLALLVTCVWIPISLAVVVFIGGN